MEINPLKNDQKRDLCIYQTKSKNCYGLNVWDNGEGFYLIDDSKDIVHLKRKENSRQLKVISES